MYDSQCEVLARHFLPAEAPKDVIEELAEWIQHHVELWMVGNEFDEDPATPGPERS